MQAPSAERCADALLGLVCACNLRALVIARGGVVALPESYRGLGLRDVLEKVCGSCLVVEGPGESYIFSFISVKMGLQSLAQLAAQMCGGAVSLDAPASRR